MADLVSITLNGRSEDVERVRLDAVLGDDAINADAAYVHVPFCFHKCHYCDFYSFVDREDRQEAFVAQLERELAAVAGRVRTDRPLTAVFVGGGTPTLLRPPLLARAMRAIRERLPLAPDVEWTVEANPETVTDDVVAALASAGVNRVSVGAQSFHERHLVTLERHHDPANVARAIDRLRAGGIERLNVDLIFGIPGSTLEEWRIDLDRALALEPAHLSCYGLTYEANTAMTERLRQGRFEAIDEDLEAAMYEATRERTHDAGFEQYEISNFARPGEACRHNLVYWRNGNWLAFGPSASGHVDGLRWKNIARLGSWLADDASEAAGASSSDFPVLEHAERVEPEERVGEELMLGLRLNEGIALSRIAVIRTNHDADGRRGRAIDAALADGRLAVVHDTARDDARVRLTRAGMLVADGLLSELV